MSMPKFRLIKLNTSSLITAIILFSAVASAAASGEKLSKGISTPGAATSELTELATKAVTGSGNTRTAKTTPTDFAEHVFKKSWSYLKKRNFNKNTFRNAVQIKEHRLIQEITLSYVIPKKTSLTESVVNTVEAVKKTETFAKKLSTEPTSAGAVTKMAGASSGPKFETVVEHAGAFECKKGEPFAIKTNFHADNKKWIDVVFTCGDAKAPISQRTLTMVIDPDASGEKDRDSLKFSTCLSQLSSGYFRVNFWGKIYACAGEESRAAYFFTRSAQFSKRPVGRPPTVDKKNAIDLLSVELDHYSGNAEWKGIKGYRENYYSEIVDTLQHSDEKYARDLAFFMSRDPKTIPGMEYALQITTQAPGDASSEAPCDGWDKIPGLFKTIVSNGGPVKAWTFEQLKDPNTRIKTNETFYPVIASNSTPVENDFTNVLASDFTSGYPLSQMAPEKYYVGGIPLKIPIEGQPLFETKNVWLCKDEAGGICAEAGAKVNQACANVGEQVNYTKSCGCQCLPKTNPLTLYARVVPVVRYGSEYRCVMRPSGAVKLTMLPYYLFDQEAIENQKKLDAQILAAEKALYDDERSHASERSPIKVDLLSYIPGQPLAEPPTDTIGIGSARIYDTEGLQYQGAGKTPFNDVMSWLSGKKTNFMWKGCAYDVDQLSAATKQLSAWWKIEHSGDVEQFVEALLDGTSDAYASLEMSVASLIAYGMDRAGISCGSECKQAIVMGIQAALASQGIPPSIPNAERMYDQGVEYAAMIVAQQAVGAGVGAFPEIANLPLAATASEKLIYSAVEAKLKSFNPFRNDGIMIEGYAGPHYTDSPYTWGKLDPYRTPGPATIWLRIRPQDVDGYLARFNGNPKYPASVMQAMYISVKSKTGIWKDQTVPVYIKTLPQVVDQATGKSTYKEFNLPVVLEPNINLNDPAADCGGGSGVCKDVGKARAIWASTKYKGGNNANDIEISSTYRWTNEPTYSVSPIVPVTWGEVTTTVGMLRSFTNTNAIPGQQYDGQIMQPPACDAFYWTEDGLLKIKESK